MMNCINPAIRILWHEPSNSMASCELSRDSGLPLITILEEESKGINPFYSYPLEWLLKYYGWVDIGEL